MSGGKYSVVTKLPSIRNYFPTTAVKRSDNISLHNELSVSSLADSPEACEGCEDPEGLVTLPGAETDFQIKDIPIVTAEGVTGPDMVYMKTIAPSVNPSYLASTCSSPDTSTSLDTAGPPTTTDFDHMYASLSKANTNVLMAENVHLREMLVSQLDLIQQQSETILSKDKQLKQLREENGLLVQRLSRMERRCRGEAGSSSGGGAAAQRKPPGVSQSGVQKRTRDHDPVTLSSPDTGLKKKKVEASPRWSEKVVPVNNEVVDAFGSSDYELMDEFMSDAEILSVSRPDTPASVASVDTVQSDTTVKSNKKSKKLSLEGKRKSANFKASTDVVAEKEPKIKKLKTQTSVSVDNLPLYETRSLYFVGCKNDVLPNTDDQLDQVAALQRGVEVPSFREDKNHYNLIVPNKLCIKKDKAKETSWRIKSTNPLYSGDGPGAEDISDQALLKRHEKFEKEEKQRKRWDLQRLREEQQLQKLRARQEKQILSLSGNKKDDASLLPNIESATYVNVGEKIPVSAFGRPLPCLPQAHFSLPWLKTKHSQY